MKLPFSKSAFLVLVSSSATAENVRGASTIPLEAALLKKGCPINDLVIESRGGVKYIFQQKGGDGKRCTDGDGQMYSYGMFRDVKDSSKCAKQCFDDVRNTLLEGFRGFDYNCDAEECYCLYDKGVLDDKNEEFDKTDERKDGKGEVADTKDKTGNFICMKLVQVTRYFTDDTEAKQYS